MPAAKKKPFVPPNTLVAALGRHFFLGRASRFLPERYGILNEPALRKALAELPKKLDAETLAARGRLRRLLGESAAAAADLDAALKLDPGLAEAHAWRWELDSGALPVGVVSDESRGKSAASAGIELAVKSAPRNGWWRLWLALARTTEGLWDAAVKEARAASELLPGEALPFAVEGLIQFKTQRYADAVKALNKALKLDSELEWCWRLRGMCLYETGDRDGCLRDSIEAMRRDENSGLLFVMFGLHTLKTETRRSVEVATRYIEKNPDDFWAYVFRADNRRSPEIGENLGAIEDLRRAVELSPKHGWVWAYLSRCQVTLGDFKGAGESMARATLLEPECGWIQAWRGELLRRAGDHRGAAKALDRAVQLFPDYELAYAWRASARRLLGNPKAALGDLNIAIALKPHTLDLCYFERMQTYRALGRTGEALEDIQKANKLNPKYAWETEAKRFGAGLSELDKEIKNNPAGALAHLWRGEIMMRLRDFARAELDLSRALERKACPPEALILRGRARCELEKWKEAFADFDAAIAGDPGAAFGYAWRGRAHMLRGDYARAIPDFNAALRKEKNSAWLLSWKGEAEFKLENWAAAEASLTKALQVHVRFADAFLWRGAARLRRGDHEGAEADLTQSLQVSPGNAVALYYRGLLRREAGRPEDARADIEAAIENPGLLTAAQVAELVAARAAVPAPRAPSSRAERVASAKALQAEGRHAEAAEVYGALLAGAPAADVLRLRAEAWRCLGRYDLALADQDAIVTLHPASAEAVAARIETKRHLYDFNGGLADAEAALKLDPKAASGWAQRGECLRSLGRYDEAIASATKAIEADPEWSWAPIVRAKAKRQCGDLAGALDDTRVSEKSGTQAYARGWRAEILRKSGRLEESLAEIVVATTLQPTNAWFLALRGQIQCELGKSDKGLADLTESMRMDPRCSCDYDFLGAEGPAIVADDALAWVYALRGGVHRAAERLPQARADLDRAAKMAPDCFWIAAWRGELRVHQGEVEAGLADLSRALKKFPRYTQAWIWTGQAQLAREATAPALAAFTSALKLEPNNVWGLIGRAVCLEKTGKAKAAAELFARAQAIAPALFAGK
ncbi:MAG: tetratricopeptide repeat protein [Elusimicrobia bacterium]|nr:tetratricopeptide repeat protein [Elusimicrobiota bacterium]